MLEIIFWPDDSYLSLSTPILNIYEYPPGKQAVRLVLNYLEVPQVLLRLKLKGIYSNLCLRLYVVIKQNKSSTVLQCWFLAVCFY